MEEESEALTFVSSLSNDGFDASAMSMSESSTGGEVTSVSETLNVGCDVLVAVGLLDGGRVGWDEEGLACPTEGL